MREMFSFCVINVLIIILNIRDQGSVTEGTRKESACDFQLSLLTDSDEYPVSLCGLEYFQGRQFPEMWNCSAFGTSRSPQ